MGIFAEAETLLFKARALDEVGSESPTNVYPLLSLSKLYVDQCRISAADELCREIGEMLRGHPSKYYRARLYFRQSAVHSADGDFPRDLPRPRTRRAGRVRIALTHRVAALGAGVGSVLRAR
jgi:hypothetical protein